MRRARPPGVRIFRRSEPSFFGPGALRWSDFEAVVGQVGGPRLKPAGKGRLLQSGEHQPLKGSNQACFQQSHGPGVPEGVRSAPPRHPGPRIRFPGRRQCGAPAARCLRAAGEGRGLPAETPIRSLLVHRLSPMGWRHSSRHPGHRELKEWRHAPAQRPACFGDPFPPGPGGGGGWAFFLVGHRTHCTGRGLRATAPAPLGCSCEKASWLGLRGRRRLDNARQVIAWIEAEGVKPPSTENCWRAAADLPAIFATIGRTDGRGSRVTAPAVSRTCDPDGLGHEQHQQLRWREERATPGWSCGKPVSTAMIPTGQRGKPARRFPVSGLCAWAIPIDCLGLRGLQAWHPGSPGGWLPRSSSVAGRRGPGELFRRTHCLVPYGAGL